MRLGSTFSCCFQVTLATNLTCVEAIEVKIQASFFFFKILLLARKRHRLRASYLPSATLLVLSLEKANLALEFQLMSAWTRKDRINWYLISQARMTARIITLYRLWHERHLDGVCETRH